MAEFDMERAISAETWDWRLPHQKRFEDLLQTGFQSDLTLLLGPEKEEMKVHKLLLQIGSKVLFSSILKRSKAEVLELPEVDPKIFKFLVNYLYTGKAGVTMAQALPLLKLASEYEIEELRDQCAVALKGEFTVNNVLSMFQAAMEYAHKDLITTTLGFICRNAPMLFGKQEFSSLRLECLVEILQQDNLWVKDEMEVFDAVYKWGLAECKRQNLDETDSIILQKILSKPLKHVRFPLMDKEKFALNVATKNVLSNDEVLALVLCFLVSEKNRSALPGGRFSCSQRLPWPKHFIVYRKRSGAQASENSTQTQSVYNAANPSALEENISFSFRDHKYPFKLTEIIFNKSYFDGFCYTALCGCTHRPKAEHLTIKILGNSFSPNSNKGNNKKPLETFSGEGKLESTKSVEHFDGICFKVTTENKIMANRLYKLEIRFEGRSYCDGYYGVDRCTYSQPAYLKMDGVKTFDRNGFIVQTWNEKLEAFSTTGMPLTFNFGPGMSNHGFIEGLRFDFV